MSELCVTLLATVETKSDEVDFLKARLGEHGVSVRTIDTSLSAHGKILDGEEKLVRMNAVIDEAIAALSNSLAPVSQVVVGLGGGTGGEIALRIMRALPITFPKVLVTTLPFDPRVAVADSSIILVPTLADISGLNATLREVFENVAAMTAGLCETRRTANACVDQTSVGITGLGATEGAVSQLVAVLNQRDEECTVFHSNGFGGAAFARFAKRGAFHAIVDLTPHEVTRLHLAGTHVPMPDRFRVGLDFPRIMVPGGINFIGLGEMALVPPEYLARPHYEHSGFFTHAKLTNDEMEQVARHLAGATNLSPERSAMIVPMGGFSHQDCPGGAIEDLELRAVFLATVQAHLDPKVTLTVLDEHISAPEVTAVIVRNLDELVTSQQESAHD